jgi:hypothetical protein
MFCTGIVADCSKVYTKTINLLCGQNTEYLTVKRRVPIVTTDPWQYKVGVVQSGYCDGSVLKLILCFSVALLLCLEMSILLACKAVLWPVSRLK